MSLASPPPICVSGKGSGRPEDERLAAAAARGQRDSALSAISDGADPDSRRDGLTALMLAAKEGHADCVRALLLHCDPKATDSLLRSALALAVSARRIECAELLLSHSDPRARDWAGATPLMIAAGLSSDMAPRLVAILLPSSELDATDLCGREALDIAKASAHPAGLLAASLIAAERSRREALSISGALGSSPDGSPTGPLRI